MPKDLPHEFQMEQVRRAMRNFKVYEHFRPDPGKALLSVKFYSKYDTMPQEGDAAKHEEYVTLVDKVSSEGPREKNPYPVTENQVYGWDYDKKQVYDKEDVLLLHHPMAGTSLTKSGLRILQDKVSQRPQFTGTPFIL